MSSGEGEVSVPSERDKNLLFGVFAVQSGIVTARGFVEAGAAWAADPSLGIPERLEQAGLITNRQRELLTHLADQVVEHHAGDEKAALSFFGGAESVSRIITEGSVSDAGASVATALDAPQMVEDVLDGEAGVTVEEAGRYTRGSEHSRGGMGRILVVHDEFLARDIALKELSPATSEEFADADASTAPLRASGSLVARFLREARVTGQLEHPSIVPVHELGRRPDGTLYYTMKLVRGKTLAESLKGTSNLTERLRLLQNFVDLCHACAYAHSRGVLHRDIKPANIMIGSFGETVVIDWGLAKIMGQKDVYEEDLRKTLSRIRGKTAEAIADTQYGAKMGTPQYMAPEQAEGRIEDLDERTDIFSLGVVLYEILTGQLPFRGETTDEILERLIHAPATPLDELDPMVPSELASICMKALHKRPEDRYPTALELAEDIQRFQTGAMVHAYDYDFAEIARRFYREHRTVLNSAFAAVVTIFVIGVYSYISILQANRREREQRQVAEGEAYLAQIRLAQAYIEDGFHNLADDVLWNTSPSRRNWEWGHLLTLTNLDMVTLEGHEGPVTRALYTNDGNQVLTASLDSTVKLWDAESGDLVRSYEGSEEGVFDLAISPDGRRFAAASGDGTVRIWSMADGSAPLVLQDHTRDVRSVAFHPSGSTLASASFDGSAKVWDTVSGELVATLAGHSAPVYWTAYSPDGTRLITEGADGKVLVWNAETWETELVIPGGDSEHVAHFDIAPDGRYVATYDGSRVSVWHLESGQLRTRYEAQEGVVRSIRFSPAGDQIVSSSQDGKAYVWSAGSGETLYIFEHGEGMKDAGFSPDGRQVFTLSQRGTVKLWDLRTGEIEATLRGHGGAQRIMFSAAYRPDSERVVTASWDGTARIWNVRDPWLPATLVRHPFPVQFAAVHPDGSRVVSSGIGAGLIVTDVATRTRIFSHAVASPWNKAVFSPDGASIATTGDGASPMILDAESADLISVFYGHEGEVYHVAFHPDGRSVASCGWETTVRIWDPRTGEEMASLAGHQDMVNHVSFNHAGTQLVTASSDNTARVWSIQDRRSLLTLEGHESPLRWAEFSPDDSTIVTCSMDRTVRIWNASTGEQLQVLRGHERTVSSAVFSPDGTRIISSSYDGKIKVWDVFSGDELITEEPNGRADTVSSVQLAPSGRFMVTTSGNAVGIFPTSPWRVVDLVGTRDMTWEARFDEYKKTRNTVAASRSSSTPVHTQFVTTVPSRLRKDLGRLISNLRSSANPDQGNRDSIEGLALEGDWLTAPLVQLGLEMGDVLLKVNGESVDSISEAVELLENEIPKLDIQPVVPLTMQIIRDKDPLAIQIRCLEPKFTRRQIQLDPEDILEQWSDTPLGSVGDNDYAELLRMNVRRWTRAGETVSEDGQLPGVWLTGGPVSLERALLSSLGLGLGDRVMAVDDDPMTSLDAFYEFIGEIVRSLESRSAFEHKINVERGEFHVIELVITPQYGE